MSAVPGRIFLLANTKYAKGDLAIEHFCPDSYRAITYNNFLHHEKTIYRNSLSAVERLL
jgi:hypothetical protein